MMLTVNPLRGEASVAIGDEMLMLQFDINAFVAMEQATGRSFLEVAAELLGAAEAGRAPKLGTMQAMVFAATRAAHADLTKADCGALFIRHAAALISGVTAALTAALPGGEDPDPGEVTPPKTTSPDGTGTVSSAAG